MKCGTCTYMRQGPSCAFCDYPKQKDDGLKKYVYWTFSCHNYTHGSPRLIHQDETLEDALNRLDEEDRTVPEYIKRKALQ